MPMKLLLAYKDLRMTLEYNSVLHLILSLTDDILVCVQNWYPQHRFVQVLFSPATRFYHHSHDISCLVSVVF